MVASLRKHIIRQWLVCLIGGLIGGSLCGNTTYAQTTTTCQTPTPPVLNSLKTDICRGESTVLSATGCAGSIIWSTGETGNQITVQPRQTTRYTALCRASQGCLSCFADVLTVHVNTPRSPQITPSSALVCAGDSVLLTATNCAGIVRWPDGSSGNTLLQRVDQTITFSGAICTYKGCSGPPSVPVDVVVGIPGVPVVAVSHPEICAGQSVTLTASGCLGTVRWNDGAVGMVHTVAPVRSQSYEATCEIGRHKSQPSTATQVSVKPTGWKPVIAEGPVTNTCPFQTADLTRVIPADASQNLAGTWVFRTSNNPNSPDVQSPTAVGAGDYYLFLRSANGCYSEPIRLTAQITPCPNGISPCVSNPARVIAWADSLNGSRGSVALSAQLRGSASNAVWSSTGTGLLTNAHALTTRYLFSEKDRQQGVVTLTLTTPDPDGAGPCIGTWASLTVTVPPVNGPAGRELIGLGKKVYEPTWLPNGEVELVYRLTVKNMGTNRLTAIQLSDDLHKSFVTAGARIQSTELKADSGWLVNPAYTGRNADTTLLMPGAVLEAGSHRSVWLTVRLAIGQASTLTFLNGAQVQAIDAGGSICRDRSTNGDDPDPDHNGNPADNDEPTLITLQSVATEGGVFIPEGFSPNGDGVNDRFVVQRVPPGIKVHLSVFNRWGNTVYVNENYQNDWTGTANQGVASGARPQGLPEGTYFYVVRLSDGREFSRFMTINR